MSFENFSKNQEKEKSFSEKIKSLMSFEKDLLCIFREGRHREIAIAFSLMTALIAFSVEETHASEKLDDSKKVENTTDESLKGNLFDLSGKKSEGNGMTFIVGEGKSSEELKTNPVEKVEFKKNKNLERTQEESSPKEDGSGNRQSRSIGEIR